MKTLIRPSELRIILILICLACLSVGGFLLISASVYGLGFPLDDAWIHQTYARNLVELREWSFIPGQPSAGSTAPFWTLLLSLGIGLGIDPKIWGYVLGGLFLATLAWLCGEWFQMRSGASWRWKLSLGILILIEWHLAWAGVSGMEIVAFTTLVIIFFLQLGQSSSHPLWAGLLIGFGTWLRPGALSLFIPALWMTVFLTERSWRDRIGRLIFFLVGAAIFVFPYLAINRFLTGAWLPSTFYAKQTEYAIQREASLLLRFGLQIGTPLIGLGVVILPGVLLSQIKRLQNSAWKELAPLVWVVIYAGTYALRLPVTYQHGRYMMPILPVLIVLGMEGVHLWVRPNAKEMWRRVSSRAWIGTIGAITLTFWFLGGRAYAQDVAIIETEMVASARWIAANTEGDSLIAAHDIGALGYFGERPILDLAGLVSPEVIPILRDEIALTKLIDSADADYLMTFPDWYSVLVKLGVPVFSTEAPFSVKEGGENMVVYRLH